MMEVVCHIDPVRGKGILTFYEPLSIDLSCGVYIVGDSREIIIQMYAKQMGWA